MKRFLFPVLAMLVFAISPALAQQNTTPPKPRKGEPAFIVGNAGIFDVINDDTTVQIGAEYVFSEDYKYWGFTPMIGGFVTGDEAVYGYAGIRLDLFFGRRIVLTPNFAIGLFEEANGRALGQPLEFRSGLELAYRFDSRARLGLAFHHLSNAGLSERNPGVETLVLQFSQPF